MRLATAAIAACVAAAGPRVAVADDGTRAPSLTAVFGLERLPEPAPPDEAPAALAAVFDAAAATRRFERAYALHHRAVDALLERHADARARAAFAAHFARQVARDERRRVRVASLREALEHEGQGSFAGTAEVLYLRGQLEARESELAFEAAIAEAEARGSYDIDAPDFSAAMDSFAAVVRDHPDHELAPAGLYLWSYYAAEMGDPRALPSLLALVCPSRFEPFQAAPITWNVGVGDPLGDCAPAPATGERVVRSAWMRIGSEFFARGELPWSIAALRRAADDPSSPEWPVAMYMRGWALYRMDAYAEALDVLDQLAEALHRAGASRQTVLPETVQLIAVMLTETWDGQAEIDPPAAIERAIDRYGEDPPPPHARAVFLALAGALRDLGAPLQAAGAYREALRTDPVHPDNPAAHRKLLHLLAQGDDRAELAAEARYALEVYAEDGPWWKANAGDPAALAQRAETVAWARQHAGD